ncbi:MAG: hypothetical protein ACI9HK_001438 [Pirellulaceae bacterium]|jgi:hypothetical protein
MHSYQETPLNLLPGECDTERLQVVLVQESGDSHIELRQQSFSDTMGWYSQSTVQLSHQQWAALKMTMGGTFSNKRQKTPSWTPRIVSAESA